MVKLFSLSLLAFWSSSTSPPLSSTMAEDKHEKAANLVEGLRRRSVGAARDAVRVVAEWPSPAAQKGRLAQI
jgi:hypothetical protein